MQPENKPNEVQTDYTTGLPVPRSADGYLFDVGSLYERLLKLTDSRHAKGKVYALVTVIVLAVLGKLAGQSRPRGIAQWARERGAWLEAALGLPHREDKRGRPRMPCYSTYSRVLGQAVRAEQLEQCVGEYLTACRREPLAGEDTVQVCIDGKKIRGTLSATRPEGVYLLGAYLPGQGLMLLQMEIPPGQGELTVAPKLLKALDLRGKLITGDAEFTQRNLSAQIIRAGGDYVWKVKDNQPTLLQDITDLFQPPAQEPQEPLPGFSRPEAGLDFRTAARRSCGHGRSEKRTLAVSSALKGYADWPGLEQVFCYTCDSTLKRTGERTHTVTYGVTSLTAREAGPARLLGIVQGHWGIESGCHYRRDVTLHEDNGQLEVGHLAQVMACLNNLVLGLTIGRGQTLLPAAQRHYDARPDEALALLLLC
jgi:predicted transposase YbfD/YdcC